MSTDPRVAAFATLALDRASAEAVTHLRTCGIEPILLKGPSFASWLYDPGEVRPYTDVDLLVDPVRWGDARDALAELGYHPVFAPRHDPAHAAVLRRDTDGTVIDLHRTLQDLGVEPSTAWRLLRTRTSTAALAGVEVTVFDRTARTLHVALHAARPRLGSGRPREDLRRALERVPEPVWREAAALAGRLGASSALATGLHQLRDGIALASRLDLPTPRTTALDEPLGSALLRRLDRAPTVAAKLGELAPWLTPDPALLRQLRPLARHGLTGLVLAYLTWPLWLLGRLAAAVRARRDR